ncbi:hypothetical protein C8J57DRAFT_1073788, partial [Mycena rebaudengoi]
AIPAVVGSKGPISSYVAALHFLYNATDVINQGYREYRNGVFLVPTLLRWDYVANGRKRIEEVASAPEHILSLEESVADNLATDYTVGEQITKNPYHVLVVRGPLTRNLSRCFPAVWEEIVHAAHDICITGVQPKIYSTLIRPQSAAWDPDAKPEPLLPSGVGRDCPRSA